MKIKIEKTIEIDPEKWALNFGIEEKDVRDDFRSYMNNVIEQSTIEYQKSKSLDK